MPRTLCRTLIAALTLAISSTASATVMVEVPLEDLIQQADVIVRGTVVSTAVRLEMREGALEPQTVTTIRVREWLAGSGGETVELRELGGVWQGGGVRFDGTPEYRAGEEVVVFLERRTDGPRDLRTLAMVQGKFEVRHGAPGVPSCVLRDLSGIAFARWADGQQTVSEPGDDPAMELETFLDFVRRVRRDAEAGL
jgi:hypothetical protein